MRSIIGKVLPAVDRPIKAEFSEFVGQWTEDAGFDEIVASLRQVDVRKWEGDPGEYGGAYRTKKEARLAGFLRREG